MNSSIFEIGATIFGLIQGLLVMFNRRSNWVFYTIQVIFLIVFSFLNHLFGDILNNFIYLVLGVIGFVTWKNKKSKITVAPLKEKILYVSIIIGGTISLTSILKNTIDPLPLLDSFTTVTSFVATYYMMKRKIDTWYIWFFNDLFYSIEYFMLPDKALYLLCLNLIWLFMAILSYYEWLKKLKEEVK